jgi:hypothetical protein
VTLSLKHQGRLVKKIGSFRQGVAFSPAGDDNLGEKKWGLSEVLHERVKCEVLDD